MIAPDGTKTSDPSGMYPPSKKMKRERAFLAKLTIEGCQHTFWPRTMIVLTAFDRVKPSRFFEEAVE